jgi:NTP pyrophosphatase (non-canonical NTP hydrolase)
MEINEMSKGAHENATSKGFYDLPNGILAKMEVCSFTSEEIKAVKDAFITQRLMLITSELSEALEANRKGGEYKEDNSGWAMDVVEHDAEAYENWFRARVKDSFEDELADATIRIGDLAAWLKVDLDKHVKLKQKYNSNRQQMHGGKAY